MVKKCPMIVMLDTQLETTDPSQAIATTSAIIQANPDLVAAFSTTGGGATAWATSAKENGFAPGKLVIVGMDCSRENADLLKNGEVYGLVFQPEFDEMYAGVVLLLEIKMGILVPYENVLPSPILYKADVDKCYSVLSKAEAVK
jgi:ribose transport system substrate-binding protein